MPFPTTEPTGETCDSPPPRKYFQATQRPGEGEKTDKSAQQLLDRLAPNAEQDGI